MTKPKTPAVAPCVTYRKNAQGEFVAVEVTTEPTRKAEFDYTAYSMQQAELGNPDRQR